MGFVQLGGIGRTMRLVSWMRWMHWTEPPPSSKPTSNSSSKTTQRERERQWKQKLENFNNNHKTMINSSFKKEWILKIIFNLFLLNFNIGILFFSSKKLFHEIQNQFYDERILLFVEKTRWNPYYSSSALYPNPSSAYWGSSDPSKTVKSIPYKLPTSKMDHQLLPFKITKITT